MVFRREARKRTCYIRGVIIMASFRFMYGYKIATDLKPSIEEYRKYVRRTREQYHSAEDHQFPIQVDGDIVYVGASVFEVGPDAGNVALQDMRIGADEYHDWAAHFFDFFTILTANCPSDSPQWYGKLIP